MWGAVKCKVQVQVPSKGNIKKKLSRIPLNCPEYPNIVHILITV